MNNIKSWLYAFRLRTLPLSFSAIISGTACAYLLQKKCDWIVLLLSLLTTLFLQILSNLANDYGDSEKGTDNEERIGPKRAVQAGMLSLKQMKNAVIVCSILAFVTGILLLYFAFSGTASLIAVLFVLLGIAAIAAAIKYTMGKNAYGYNGLGDIFVFIFFGLVGVGGSYYLQAKTMDWSILLMGISIGCFATAVLNLNNMRDEISDKNAGKNTLVVKIGGVRAKKYSNILLFVGWVAALLFSMINFLSIIQFSFLLSVLIFIKIQRQIYTIQKPADFDPYLKQLALGTFIFSVLFAAGAYLAVNI